MISYVLPQNTKLTVLSFVCLGFGSFRGLTMHYLSLSLGGKMDKQIRPSIIIDSKHCIVYIPIKFEWGIHVRSYCDTLKNGSAIQYNVSSYHFVSPTICIQKFTMNSIAIFSFSQSEQIFVRIWVPWKKEKVFWFIVMWEQIIAIEKVYKVSFQEHKYVIKSCQFM